MFYIQTNKSIIHIGLKNLKCLKLIISNYDLHLVELCECRKTVDSVHWT